MNEHSASADNMQKKHVVYISVLLSSFALVAAAVSANVVTAPAPQAASSLSFSAPAPKAPKRLSMTAIDVGRGDALLITFPNGKHMLVDGGTKYDADTFVLPYLKSHHVKTLDAIVVTHEHDDHLEGMIEVLKHTKVLKAYDSGFPLKKADGTIETKLIGQYNGALTHKKVKHKVIRGGDSLQVGSSVAPSRDVKIDVLSPYPSLIKTLKSKLNEVKQAEKQLAKKIISKKQFNKVKNRILHRVLNEGSVILRLSYGKNRFLLMGDAGSIAASDITQVHHRSVKADVLKVGHHGFGPVDKKLYGQVFTKKYNRIAIITYGRLHRNKISTCEPWSKAVISNLKKQGAKVLSSCKWGNITVTAYGSGNVLVSTQGSSKKNTCPLCP